MNRALNQNAELTGLSQPTFYAAMQRPKRHFNAQLQPSSNRSRPRRQICCTRQCGPELLADDPPRSAACNARESTGVLAGIGAGHQLRAQSERSGARSSSSRGAGSNAFALS